MDKVALSKRLESLSEVFASQTPMYRDLKAMAHVLANMAEDRYAMILSDAYSPEVAAGIADEDDSTITGCGIIEKGISTGPGRGLGRGLEKDPVVININVSDDKDKEESPIEDSVEDTLTESLPAPEACGPYKKSDEEEEDSWDKCASEKVVDYILKDVLAMDKKFDGDTGLKLKEEQKPQGHRKGLPSTPPELKKEQTPDQKETLDSDMVAKSKVKNLKKEAAEDEVEKEDTPISKLINSEADRDEANVEKKRQKAEDAMRDVEESPEKAPEIDLDEDILGEDKKEEKDTKEASDSSFGGIELCASMEDVDMSSEEIEKLSSFFK